MAGTDEKDSGAGAAVPPDAAPAPAKKASRKKAPAADPEALAADIERTREELAETLDAIAEKVSPKRVAKRTTKKVGDTVKGTAHDAAAAVKETASSAKDKVLHPEDAAHPSPLPASATAATAATAATSATSGTAATAEVPAPWSAPPSLSPASTAYSAPPSLLRPEYLAAGAAAALVAWLLVRRRR